MNIIDYIKINCDKSFDELAFNEVDGLIFAQLSYMSYSNICTSFDDVIDSKNLNSYETSILLSKRNYGDILNDKRLIREVLSSKRYYGMKFGHYVNDHNEGEEKQFSAITFIFEHFVCVSYMGTDDTILGWKEDFSMSYKENVASQKEGVEYLKQISNIYDKDMILTGHSKGGNIAIYSACNIDSLILGKLKKIYAYDAPGFNQSFIIKSNYIELKHDIEVYIPESSFIGLIMYSDDNYKVVASNKSFLHQHNVYNWLISDGGFFLKERLSKKSLAFSESNRNWLETFSDEERKIFFDTIFDLLEYKENKSFLDLKNNWKAEANRIFKESKDISKENKELMSEITRNMFRSYIKLLFSKKKY